MKFFTLVLLILLSVITFNGYGQKKRIAKADKYFEAGEYSKASELYLKAYGKAKEKPVKGEISFRTGICFRKMNDSKKAELWFKKAVSNKYKNPESRLYLADAYKMNGNMEEALIEYSNYKDLVPDDPRSQMGIESCNLVNEWMKKPTRYIVQNALWLNSKWSDFNAGFGTDSFEVYFTSARESSIGNKVNTNSGMFFTDIFIARKDKKGKWSEPVPVAGAVNTEYDEGVVSLTRDKKRMYFTSCRVGNNAALGCQIYYSDLTDNKWGAPTPIVIFKDSSISVGHPCISPDDKTLYFVSDKKDGNIGGKDIWKMERSSPSDSWGLPENLGDQINTKEDEVYPFIADDGTLYFASNGHLGMGGLDIFKVTKDEKGKIALENLKYPVNSTADDFAIVFFENEEKGYFSSTRPEGKGDDLYFFYNPPYIFSIKGIVKDEKTFANLNGARIKMTGSDGTQLETTTGNDGSFKFDLRQNVDYVFVSTKDKYLKGVGKESTKGLKENKVLKVELLMMPINIVIEIPNIEYDFGKATLREESKVSLDDVVDLLEVNDNITIEINSHTDFRGTDEANMKLSQDRAQSVVDHLISKGIKADRLSAKGYGESKPATISKKQAEKFPFLKENDVLSEDFINKLANEQEREIAHQLNRRTEFRVLRTDYKETGIPFGND